MSTHDFEFFENFKKEMDKGHKAENTYIPPPPKKKLNK